jgi:hypothetical protein
MSPACRRTSWPKVAEAAAERAPSAVTRFSTRTAWPMKGSLQCGDLTKSLLTGPVARPPAAGCGAGVPAGSQADGTMALDAP